MAGELERDPKKSGGGSGGATRATDATPVVTPSVGGVQPNPSVATTPNAPAANPSMGSAAIPQQPAHGIASTPTVINPVAAEAWDSEREPEALEDDGMEDAELVDVKVKPDDQKIVGDQYGVETAVELMFYNEKTKKLEHTGIFICFADPVRKNEYIQRLKDVEDAIKEAKAAAKDPKDADYSKVKELGKKLADENKEIRKAYPKDGGGPQSRNAGYMVIRTDAAGKKTNLAKSAAGVAVVTNGLDEKSCIRIRMGNGCFLEIHLDENGNFDPENPVVALTNAGAEQARLFNAQDGHPNFIYNNYEKVLDDLRKMEFFTVNGKNILGELEKTFGERLAVQTAAINGAEARPAEEEVLDDDSIAPGNLTPTPKNPDEIMLEEVGETVPVNLGKRPWVETHPPRAEEIARRREGTGTATPPLATPAG